MKKKIFFTLIIIGIAAYLYRARYIAHFEIVNTTDATIDSAMVTTGYDKSIEYVTIKPYDTIKYNLNMYNVPNVDGGYGISYKINSRKRSHGFGYYTNGLPIENLTTISITKDTIHFDCEYPKY